MPNCSHTRRCGRTTPVTPARARYLRYRGLGAGMGMGGGLIVRVPGLGDVQTVATSAPSIAGGALTSLAAASSTAVGGSGMFLGMTVTTAIPVIGAVVAGVTLALIAIFSRKGPKQRVATTQIVNKVEPLLQQNLAGYMAGPRTVTSQAQALENFKAGWQYVVDNCDVPVMGNPGKACVADRQRGGQWDWFSYYYDPIANDPEVRSDAAAILGASTDGGAGGDAAGSGLLQSSVGGVPTPLLLAGVALAAALTMGGKR